MGSPPNLDDLKLGEDSDDDFKYEEVEVMSDDGGDDASEDLDTALRSLQAFTQTQREAQANGAAGRGVSGGAGRGNGAAAGSAEPAPGQVARKPEVIDDFLRNFFVKMGLSRTCEAFEAEWYELKATGRLDAGPQVPDVYLRNAALEDEVAALRRELSDAKAIAAKASATWDQFRKERDFHRMHHKRVAQEKNKLITDIKRLKEHYAKYEPTILELKKKYETAMKEKMLASLERDKAMAKVDALDAQLRAETAQHERATASASPGSRGAPLTNGQAASTLGAAAAGNGGLGATSPGSAGAALSPQQLGQPRRTGWAAINAPPRKNPFEDVEFPATNVKGFSMQKTFKGHVLSVAALALHPSKPILVTASDDKTWKMWHMPHGDLIMCGEGHKDWVAGVDFHPAGVGLASCSGDATVKIWDFERQKCVSTYSDHKQAVWAVKYHHSGDVVASASLDHTVRLWDLPVGKCRMALRGHVDSVNDLCWQPFSSNVCTASSDKTVSVWDARSGLCTQTFYGHHNSCNSVALNLLGTVVASCDADGAVKLWDTRMVAEIMTLDAGKHPANKVAFDRSGLVLAVASDDGTVRCFNTVDGDLLSELSGHEDAAQSVVFDPAGQYAVTCGSDTTFRLWA